MVLFPARAIYLEHFQETKRCDEPAAVEYSQEILEYMSPDDLRSLRVPCLAQLLLACCRRYVKDGDDMGAIGMEQLIDGMDLDMPWLATYLPGMRDHEIAQVGSFIAGKESRAQDVSPSHVTCFIPTDEEARRVRSIPGRNFVFHTNSATTPKGR